MKTPTILIVERNDTLREELKRFLLQQGYNSIESSNKTEALKIIQCSVIHLVIVGLLDSGRDSLQVVQEIRRWNSVIPLILIAHDSTEELAIAALKVGISDYFKQPVSFEEFAASLRRCLFGASFHTSSEIQETPCQGLFDTEKFIGDCLPMKEIRTCIGKVAQTDSNVLITGETGTGKELTAELIHKNSSRNKNPFVCINCTAIPDSLLESELFGYERGAFTGADTLKEGKLKQSEGGTVFLDEIGDMSLYHQAKILRVIESKEIQRLGGKGNISLDIRIVAATNKNLEEMVSEGTFRKDLYYRLNVANIHLPPLRQRREDIAVLLDHYVLEISRRFGRDIKGFSGDTLEFFHTYDWPGNIREMKNLLEAVIISTHSQWILLHDLPETFRHRVIDARMHSEDEKDRLLAVLLSTNWNKAKAARKLNWSRMTLYRKMERYQISQPKSSMVTCP
ncbi:MAG: two-component system response regulator [Candidatus Brocadia sp. WS118]|nr:MAG: two-component system response regulator [Candidatus Brocadia sp. WS118]